MFRKDLRFRRERRLLLIAITGTVAVAVGIGYVAWEQLEIEKAESAIFADAETTVGEGLTNEEAPLPAEEPRQLGSATPPNEPFERAVADFTQALERAPTAEIYYDRSEALRALGRTTEALADLQRAVELEPEHPLYSNKLGIVQLANGAAGVPRMEFRSTNERSIAQPPKGRIFIAILNSLREGRFNDSTVHLEAAANLLPPAIFTTLLDDPELTPYHSQPAVSRYLPPRP